MAAFLVAAAMVEWSGWWHEQIDRATLVVAGEVIALRDADGKNPVAVFRVDRTLKGKASPVELIPFKTRTVFACDVAYVYETGKRYLLLIDDKEPWRLVWFLTHVQTEILTLSDVPVRFTEAVLASRNGDSLEPYSEVIEELLRDRKRSRALDVMAFLSTLTRKQARPILPMLRETVQAWSRRRLENVEENRRNEILNRAVGAGFDLGALGRILEGRQRLYNPFHNPTGDRPSEDPVQILARVTGRTFPSIEAARAEWPTLVRRSRTDGNLDRLPELLRRLRSESVEERDAAGSAILDLGPGILEGLKTGASTTPEIRARLGAIRAELEFLEDLRTELMDPPSPGR